jgi:2'-5' RNA ligase
LEEHIQLLRSEVPDAAASWSRPENVHLTLKFFGNIDQDRIQAISAAIARAVGTQFRISVGGSGVFPKASQARVLWIGISDPTGKLAELQRRVEDECAAQGVEKEERAFRPHLTIARLRRPDGARQLAEAHLRMGFEPNEVLVKELILFRSELSSKGPTYTPVTRHVMEL